MCLLDYIVVFFLDYHNSRNRGEAGVIIKLDRHAVFMYILNAGGNAMSQDIRILSEIITPWEK